MNKLKYSVAIFTLSFVFVFLAGCQLLAADSVSSRDIFDKHIASKTGSYAEQFIPYDVSAVVAIDYQDASQHQAFDKIRKNFATDEEWLELLEDTYLDLNSEVVTDFEGQVLDVFGDYPRFVFAADKAALDYAFSYGSHPPYQPYSYDDTLIPELDTAVNSNSNVDVEYDSSDVEDKYTFDNLPATGEFDGNWYVVAKVDNTQKYNDLVALLIEDGGLSKVDDSDAEIYVDDETFMTRYQDMLVISNSLENVKSAVSRAKNAEDSIKDNPKFEKTFSKIVYPHFGYVYIDMQDYYNAYQSVMLNSDPELSNFVNSFYKQFAVGTATASSLVLEDDGIRLFSYGYIDEDTLAKDDKGFEIFSGDVHLFEKIPGDGMIFYEEISGGFAQIMNLFLEAMNAELAVANPEKPVDIEAQFKAFTGLDLQKDLLAFMDKNFAFYWSHSDGIIPNFGLWLDASSAPEAAIRTFDVFDSTVTVGLMGIKAGMSTEQASLIVKDKVNLSGREVNRVSVDFSSFSEQDKALLGIPDLLANEKIEFYYGVTGDDVAIFGLHRNLDKLYGRTGFDKSENYKEALKHLDLKPKDTIAYFQVDRILQYLNDVSDFFVSMGEDSLLDDEDVNEVIERYITPVKYLLIGNDVTRTESISEGFIKISK